eukprot:COSAG04_NODE_18661_length_435_cov_1.229167_2_plen_48_part_01
MGGARRVWGLWGVGSRLRLGTPMAYVDGVYIVLISLVAALLSEGISWW